MPKFQFPRMSGWLLLAVALMAVIASIAPQKLEVSVYKLALMALAGVGGYWLDRSIFPYARPDSYLNVINWKLHLRKIGKQAGDADLCVASGYEQVFAAAMLRRALIVGACIFGVALGL